MSYQEPQVTVLVLDYSKPIETRRCLESICRHLLVAHKTVLLDNGGGLDYPWQLYKDGLCDVLISKRVGRGGGYGQTDLFRWCDTPFALFLQNDQELLYDVDETQFARLAALLDGYQCVDLNGDQSGRGVWSDRAHLIKTDFFNSLAPFPNGGPGLDAAKWNEQYLQEVFADRGCQIAHVKPALFADCGKWSVRESGDGILKHRCDTKQMYVVKQPTYLSDVYPPLNEDEKRQMLAGEWVDGTIPVAWLSHSFAVPAWH